MTEKAVLSCSIKQINGIIPKRVDKNHDLNPKCLQTFFSREWR